MNEGDAIFQGRTLQHAMSGSLTISARVPRHSCGASAKRVGT